jgi:hypothetical protein
MSPRDHERKRDPRDVVREEETVGSESPDTPQRARHGRSIRSTSTRSRASTRRPRRVKPQLRCAPVFTAKDAEGAVVAAGGREIGTRSNHRVVVPRCPQATTFIGEPCVDLPTQYIRPRLECWERDANEERSTVPHSTQAWDAAAALPARTNSPSKIGRHNAGHCSSRRPHRPATRSSRTRTVQHSQQSGRGLGATQRNHRVLSTGGGVQEPARRQLPGSKKNQRHFGPALAVRASYLPSSPSQLGYTS